VSVSIGRSSSFRVLRGLWDRVGAGCLGMRGKGVVGGGREDGDCGRGRREGSSPREYVEGKGLE